MASMSGPSVDDLRSALKERLADEALSDPRVKALERWALRLPDEHVADAIELFTIGQRKGLPGGSLRPRYVVDLDPETNRVIIGDSENLVCVG